MANKQPRNFRLSEEALVLLEQWSNRLGLSKAGILELAIREFDASRNPPAAPEAEKEAG